MDPLDPDTVRRLPLYAHASPCAFVIHPGEAVIIAQVWCLRHARLWQTLLWIETC